VRGMSYSPSVAERRWARPSSTDTGLTMSEIYSGAVPVSTALCGSFVGAGFCSLDSALALNYSRLSLGCEFESRVGR